MIDLIIFYFHTIVAVYAFTKSWQEENFISGIVSVAFILIIFAIGWTIATLSVTYIIPSEGFAKWMNRDTISLMLLTIGESFFYYHYFKSKNKKV